MLKRLAASAVFGALLATAVISPASAASLPGQIIDTTPWKWQSPHNGVEEVENPELHTYRHDQWFKVNRNGDAVMFRARVDGDTTSGSKYPRSELREMRGKDKASWTSYKGFHALTGRMAVKRAPKNKPEVVFAQVHGTTDNILMLMYDGKRNAIVAEIGDDIRRTLIPYELGQRINYGMYVSGGQIRVYINGRLETIWNERGTTWYFKAGAYVLSNEDYDADDEVGEVSYSRLFVRHR